MASSSAKESVGKLPNRSFRCKRNGFNRALGSLTELESLDISQNKLSRKIPLQLTSLTFLAVLNLSYNQLDLSNQFGSRVIFIKKIGDYVSLKLEKPNLKTLIENKRSLRDLYLDGVDISSESSKWCETTSLALPKLGVLSISDSGFTGPLCSSLLRLPHLSKLILDDNPISYLPSKISSLLVSLSLRGCNLNGHFPAEFFLLPKMQKIDISLNFNLRGQLPEFPTNNTTLELQSLTLKFCNFSGPIPASFANLTNLVELGLSWNNFNGLIPPFHRYGVPSLALFDLSWNHLSGSISSSLFTLSSLCNLFLQENQLDGEIDEFCNASFFLLKN